MRNKIIFVFLSSLTLLGFGAVPKSVNGQEAPYVLAQANSPGWITVSWEHTGEDVYYFTIERQDSPYPIAQSYNRTDSVTDKNLKANTVYNYRVCAVYAYSQTCSPWVSVRTLPPPSSSPGGSSGNPPPSSPPPAPTPFAPPQLTATQDQDPNFILLDWSGTAGWHQFAKWGNPPTPTYQNPQLKQVKLYRSSFNYTGSDRVIEGNLILEPIYDGLKYIGQSVNGGGLVSWLSLRAGISANTAYTFKICFTDINDETKCSKEIIATGKPVAPTAPVDVTVFQDEVQDSVRGTVIRTRTLVTARWRNTIIHGQFITLEREDRVIDSTRTLDRDGRVQVQDNQPRFRTAWVEIKRISAAASTANLGGPTEIKLDTTPQGPVLLTERGKNYRVCAVVPALGAAGKVCSSPVSPLPNVDVVRPVDPKRINRNVLTPKKPE
jgi:hypothetical protein